MNLGRKGLGVGAGQEKFFSFFLIQISLLVRFPPCSLLWNRACSISVSFLRWRIFISQKRARPGVRRGEADRLLYGAYNWPYSQHQRISISGAVRRVFLRGACFIPAENKCCFKNMPLRLWLSWVRAALLLYLFIYRFRVTLLQRTEATTITRGFQKALGPYFHK